MVGAASRDLVTDDPRGWRLGGAVAYSALALARLGLRVRALVGVDEPASSAPELDLLREAGADVVLVPLTRGPVFRNEEHPTGRIQTAVEVTDPMPIAAVPVPWLVADAVLLAPVAGELSDDWLGAIRADAFVALGWQGLLRDISPGAPVVRRRPAPSRLVARATLVGLSRTDVEPDQPIASLERLLAPDAELLVTDAERGGFLAIPGHPSGRRRWRTYRAIPPDSVVDPTGAGDVFLATLFAARVDPRRLGGPQDSGLDLRLAAAAGSLSVEAPGLFGVPDLASVLRRATRRRSG